MGIPGRLKVLLELFPMPAFMLVSGLFAPRSLKWSFPELWRRRLLPIAYLYIVWSLVRYAFFFVFPALNSYIGTDASRDPWVLVQIVTGPANIYWFLYALIIFSVGAWLLRRVPPLVQILPAALLSAAFTSGWLSTGTVVWDRVGGLFVFFLVGIHWAKQISSFVATATWRTLVWMILAFATVGFLLYLPGVSRIPLVITVAQSFSVACGIVLSSFLVRLRPLRFIDEIGDKSLQIYVLHLYVVALVAFALGAIGLPDLPMLADSLIVLAGTFVVVVMTLWIVRLTGRWRWLYIPPTRWLVSRSTSRPSSPRRLKSEES